MNCASTDSIQINGITDPDTFPEDPTIFKQFEVEEELEVPEVKPDMEQILSLMIEGVVDNLTFIETPVGTSLNQTLTGQKAIVEGRLLQKIEYVADKPEQSVHSAHFEVPFCTFLVIPADFDPRNDRLNVKVFIEHVFVEQLNEREFFKNVTIFLNGTVA